MEIANNTYQPNFNEEQKTRAFALRLMLYIGMASITMFFAVTTSSLIVKKADTLNWAQFPLPNVFTISTIIAIISSALFYFTYKTYKKAKFNQYLILLLVSGISGLAFLISQLIGFNALTNMDFPLSGNVSGSFIYFLAIVHGLHIITGLVVLLIVWIKSYLSKKDKEFEGSGIVNPNRVLALELLTTYWHFVNALWVYLYVFFYFNYQ
ncbi:MAG: cytochrome c oxidase subunit 3 [Chitinophagales bacterium]|nr:cytochrome c oxidase subunit 3 [Chitinophagales bacterium]